MRFVPNLDVYETSSSRNFLDRLAERIVDTNRICDRNDPENKNVEDSPSDSSKISYSEVRMIVAES